MNEDAKNNAIKMTHSAAEKYVSIAGAELNSDLSVARTLMYSLIKYPDLSPEKRTKIFDPILEKTVMSNPNFLSVWYTWELNAIDENYIKSYGRERVTFYRQDDVKGYITEKLDTIGNLLSSTYYKIKINPKEIMVDPYYGNYTGNTDDNILMSTVAVPLYVKNKFAGIVGIDFALDRFQNITEKIKPFEDAYSFIIANNSNIVAFSNKKLANKPLTSFFYEEESKYGLSDKIQKGNKFNFYTERNGVEYYISLLPLKIGNSSTPWAIGIMTPVNKIIQRVKISTFVFSLVSILGLFLLTYMIWLISKKITKPLRITTKVIDDMARGNIDERKKINIKTDDEISDIAGSVNVLIDSLNKAAFFAGQIEKGNLKYKYKPLSKYDLLGNSLLAMRKSLKIAKEEDIKRKEKDRKLNWATHGTAKFAEIIRLHSDDLENLAYEIISELVKYIGANQGGLFVINEENNKNKFVELIASYAFERKKMNTKKIPFGVGLVGRCLFESETIYMTNIPNEYINITSGLGKNNPKELLIVPLIFNNKTFGAVEIAGFKKIEEYKIKFVEKIGESIASAISMVNINIKTTRLLDETKSKSDEMTLQEEKIKQNVYELKLIQKKLNNEINEMKNVMEATNAISYIIEFDIEGKIIDINDNFVRFLRRDKVDIIGKYQGSLSIEPQNIRNFDEFQEQLRNGIVKKRTQKIKINNEIINVPIVYSPVFNKNNEVYKVIGVAGIDKK